MALSRANAEYLILRRCGKLLLAAQLDGSTDDGTNADLVDPLASAIRALGGTVVSRVDVSDADVATVSREEALLDVAELRALESALGNLDVVDVQVGPERENLNQLGQRLELAIARARAKVQRVHGIELAPAATPSVSSNTMTNEATW